MRRGEAIAPQTQSQVRESADERDARLELRWRYARDGERSTLAFVSVRQDELATEFFAWRRLHPGGEMRDGIVTWEHQRFGDALDRVSHSLLAFAVRSALAPEDGGRKPYRKPVPTVPHDPGRLIAGAIQGHAMPVPRMNSHAVDRRIAELRAQSVGAEQAQGATEFDGKGDVERDEVIPD